MVRKKYFCLIFIFLSMCGRSFNIVSGRGLRGRDWYKYGNSLHSISLQKKISSNQCAYIYMIIHIYRALCIFLIIYLYFEKRKIHITIMEPIPPLNNGKTTSTSGTTAPSKKRPRSPEPSTTLENTSDNTTRKDQFELL